MNFKDFTPQGFFARFIGVRGVLIGVGIAAVFVLGFMNKNLQAELDAAEAAIVTKDTRITELTKELEAIQTASLLDRQEATQSYNDAQLSCDRRIQAAVEAVSAPLVNPTPEVPQNAPAGTPPACDCPSRRLRDVTRPFGLE